MIGPAKVLVYLLLISSQPAFPRGQYHRLVQIYDGLDRDPRIVLSLVCTPQVH